MLRRALLIILGVLFLPLPAFADCTSPSMSEGAIFYNSSSKLVQYCDGTTWVPAHWAAGTGSGGCALAPSGTYPEGQIMFNVDHRVMQACAGNVWRAMGPTGGSGDWTQISVGNNHGGHTCGIKNDGTLWCWGLDSLGQLGNGSGITSNQSNPSQEATAATDWASVSAGMTHTCAVKTDGRLYCWGTDSNGRLGNGAGGNSHSPSQESSTATNWSSVSAGEYHTCAIKTNGTLWCWGRDNDWQLGNGSTNTDQQSPVQEATAATDWAFVSAGNSNTCAIKTTGTLWCWGDDNNGRLGNGGGTLDVDSPSQESSLSTNWTAVSVGHDHTCATKTDGRLYCWGSDSNGQLGNAGGGGNLQSPNQETTAATNWASVSAGTIHTCATKTNGTIYCWGGDVYGELGNGATTGNQQSPGQEATTAANWGSVAAGEFHTCGLKTNGMIYCWGNDSNGQLGNGATSTNQQNPTQESTVATNWASVKAGYEHTCAVKTGGGALFCWGSDQNGKLGNGSSGDQVSPFQESSAATNWASVALGNIHSCAVKTNGTLWCWGGDGYDQLGNGASGGNQQNPVQEITTATDWASVAAGEYHTCAVKTGGTLWCWGYDGGGGLGNGAGTSSQHTAVQESTAATNWLSVSAGREHTCAVKTGGTLYCWGNDGNGQVGNGATTGNQQSPVQESTAATNWASVSAGYDHTCAIKTNGTLYCWGSDGNEQIGNGATSGNQVGPVQESTAATNWASVSAGRDHTCALTTGGTLSCWGGNSNGQLANGTIGGYQASPVQESTAATNWAFVTAGLQHTCAVKTTGALYCWGSDQTGQLGSGILSYATSPIVGSTLCANPQQSQGVLLYNSSNNAMQYCDGVSWVRVGK